MDARVVQRVEIFEFGGVEINAQKKAPRVLSLDHLESILCFLVLAFSFVNIALHKAGLTVHRLIIKRSGRELSNLRFDFLV